MLNCQRKFVVRVDVSMSANVPYRFVRAPEMPPQDVTAGRRQDAMCRPLSALCLCRLLLLLDSVLCAA